MVLRSTRLRRFSYLWVERPSIDLLLAAAVGAGLTLVSAWRDWGQIIASADAPARRAVFQVVAGLSGTLLGLTLTSLSLLVGLIRTPVAQIEVLLSRDQRVDMARGFVAALVALGFGFLLATWAILNDTKDGTTGSSVVQAIILSGTTLAALRIARVIWILWKLLEITARGSIGHDAVIDEVD